MSRNHTTIDSTNESSANHTDRKRTNGKSFVHPLSKVTSQLADRVSDLVIEDLDDEYEIPAEIVYNDANYTDIQNGNQINELDAVAYETKQWTKLETLKKEHIYEQIVLKNGSVDYSDVDDDNGDEVEIDDKEPNGNVAPNGIGIESDAVVPDILKQQKSFVHTISAKCANGGEKPPESPTLSHKSSSDSETRSTKSQLFAICAQANGLGAMHEPVDRDTAVSVTLETMANDIYETIDSQDVNDDSAGLQQSHNLTVSSASIYSSNSTSSSASDDHSPTKQNVSYLASNESLAEHNESEPPKLTPTECVCVEIVESERAYNNDLRQIIQGYVDRERERKAGITYQIDSLRSLDDDLSKILGELY